ncbi:unnamed protein product [Caenorhabditis auriculariae]|uniref:CCHC-type domain-containing protein n=1 Tax=Caenorhabditis auriculariae TaxID=2777116 RepID=A0A8S1HZ68_9PELO|nr:unnamed protein product [Caenorhabditis auriculariae]
MEEPVPTDFTRPLRLNTQSALGRRQDSEPATIFDLKALKLAIVRDLVVTHQVVQKIAEAQDARISALEKSSEEDSSDGSTVRSGSGGTPDPASRSTTPDPASRSSSPTRASTPPVNQTFAFPTATQQITVAAPPQHLSLVQGTPRPPRINVLSAADLRNRGALPVFRGNPHEDFNTFIRAFEDVANATDPGLADDVKKAHLLTYLADNARDKAEELLTSSPPPDFKELKESLRNAFQDPLRVELARQQLRSCTQLPMESVEDFSARVKKLARAAFGQQGRSTVNEKCLEAFVDGLKYDLKFHVKSSFPKDFQSAESAALRYEMWFQEAVRANIINPGMMPTTIMQRPQESRPPTGPANQARCFYCDKPGHFVRDCRSKARDQAAGRGRRGYSNRGNFQNQQGPPPQQHDPIMNHQMTQPNDARQFVQNWNGAPNVQACQAEETRNQVEEQAEIIRLQQARIEALLQRNNELTQNVTSAGAQEESRINVAAPQQRQGNRTSVGSNLRLGFILICFLFTPALAINPLICLPHAPRSYFLLPPRIECSRLAGSDSSAVKRVSLTVWRPNIIEYESSATLCKIIQRTTIFSVNFFGARSETSFSKQLTVSLSDCQIMMNHKRCAHGELFFSNGIFQTNNPHAVPWPTPPYWPFAEEKTFVSTNCIMLNTKVISHFDESTPSSPAGQMTACSYRDGFCNQREGAAFIWRPNPNQACRFVKFKVLSGFLSKNIWLGDEKEFALSFNASSLKVQDCGNTLILTDQGFAISPILRRKRDSEPALSNLTNFVSSNQLAAQLLAVQKDIIATMYTWVSHNLVSWCASLNAIAASSSAAAANNPTLVARQLLNRTDISARYLGNRLLAVQACTRIPKASFNLEKFIDQCYSKPSIRVSMPNNSSFLTFFDPVTDIVTSRAHPVPCSLVNNFEFVHGKSLVRFNPFTLESEEVEDFRPRSFPVEANTPAPEEDMLPTIFHNMVIGSLSETIQPTHYNEIWLALEGSPEALTRMVSAHDDPKEGHLVEVMKYISFWERTKLIWDTVFYIWTILVCLAVTAYAVVVAKEDSDASLPQINKQDIEFDYAHLFAETPKKKRSPRVNTVQACSTYFTAQIPVKINRVNALALIDTGAGLTISSAELCPLMGIASLSPTSTNNAIGLGGNAVQIVGKAEVEIQIGSLRFTQTTHFTKTRCTPGGASSYDIILGNDFLSKLPKFHLDYKKGSFHVGNERLPLGSYVSVSTISPSSEIPIKVKKHTVIPAQSEAFVECAAPVVDPAGEAVLVSQANKISDLDLLVAPALFSTGAVKLLISNPTNEPKTLFQNTTAAYACPTTTRATTAPGDETFSTIPETTEEEAETEEVESDKIEEPTEERAQKVFEADVRFEHWFKPREPLHRPSHRRAAAGARFWVRIQTTMPAEPKNWSKEEKTQRRNPETPKMFLKPQSSPKETNYEESVPHYPHSYAAAVATYNRASEL